MTLPDETTQDSRTVSIHPNPVVRGLLSAGGVLAVVLGFLGVFLPGLPTTPFLLLAGWCFLRSSPRLHAWLMANRWFGPVLRQWSETRTVPVRAKRTAIALVLLTFAASIAVVPSEWQRWMLLGICGIVVTVVLLLPTDQQQS